MSKPVCNSFILNSLIILPSPSIMLERDTSLAEQPFNGESMVNGESVIYETGRSLRMRGGIVSFSESRTQKSFVI